MDTKINIYISSIFLKTAQFFDNFDCNVSNQHFVNIKKFTFEIDNLQNTTENEPPCWHADDVTACTHHWRKLRIET